MSRDAALDPESTPEARSETTRETIAFHGYRLAQWLGRHLPEHTGLMVFRWLGKLAYATATTTRATVAENQARVLGRPPEDPLVEASTREAFDRYARYWYDTFHVTSLPRQEFIERFESTGAEHLVRAREEGTGVIVAMPHIGNWDAASAWLGTIDIPRIAVSEELRPRRLYELFVAHRESLGMEVVGTGSPRVGSRLRSALADNQLVALVADRDLSGRGLEVEMFGAPRRLPAGPALLSLSTGAPLTAAATYQTDRGWHCVITPPLTIEETGDRRTDVMALTRRLAEEFEALIAAAPSDWHVFQPAWDQ